MNKKRLDEIIDESIKQVITEKRSLLAEMARIGFIGKRVNLRYTLEQMTQEIFLTFMLEILLQWVLSLRRVYGFKQMLISFMVDIKIHSIRLKEKH